MKGNRGPKGRQFPSFRVDPFDPIDTGQPLRPKDKRRRFAVGLVLAVLAASGIAALVAVENRTPEAPAPGGAQPAAIETPGSPASTPVATAQATPAPATATRTSTPTVAPTPTPTVVPTATPSPAPSLPPVVRTRYVVKSGDGCEVIRLAFKYATTDFEDFQLAMGRLSGRTPANQCILNQGNVLCLPAQRDLANIAALTRDDACLAGP